jgi:hypothetical protein
VSGTPLLLLGSPGRREILSTSQPDLALAVYLSRQNYQDKCSRSRAVMRRRARSIGVKHQITGSKVLALVVGAGRRSLARFR